MLHPTSCWTTQGAVTLGIRRVALLGMVVLGVACGSDTSTPPTSPTTPTTPTTPATAAGSYSISTVNGGALPVALAVDTSGLYKYEITGGTIALTSDGKYSVVTNYRQTIPGSVELFVDSTGGAWTQTGTAISFTNAQDGSTDNAVWSNTGLLTFNESSGTTTTTFVYGLKK